MTVGVRRQHSYLPHRAQILGIRRLLPQGQLSQAAQGSCGDHPTQWMFEVVKYGGNSERSLRKNFKNSHRNRELILWLDVTAGKEKDCLRRAASLYRAKDLHAARWLLYKAKFAAQVSPSALRQGAVL